jgi:hypothetical protein
MGAVVFLVCFNFRFFGGGKVELILPALIIAFLRR